jgi:hypothetical protein
MSELKVPFNLRLQISIKSLGYLLSRPLNLFTVLLLMFLMLGILLWSFNLDLLRFVFFESTLGVSEKLQFLLGGYASLFTNLDALPALTMVVLSLLFGINGMIFAYLVKRTAKLSADGKGIVASVLGLIGAGCAVCGTGIIGPVLAGVGATASAGLTYWIGIWVQLLGIGLLAYSIFGLSIRAASLKEQ